MRPFSLVIRLFTSVTPARAVESLRRQLDQAYPDNDASAQRREFCFNSRLINRTLRGRCQPLSQVELSSSASSHSSSSRFCLALPLALPDLGCIGGSSASTPVWFPELRQRREGANRCIMARAGAQVASQLKLATVLLLGTACFSMATHKGSSGCTPSRKGECAVHTSSCPCLIPLLSDPSSSSQVSSTWTTSGTSWWQAVHLLIVITRHCHSIVLTIIITSAIAQCRFPMSRNAATSGRRVPPSLAA